MHGRNWKSLLRQEKAHYDDLISDRQVQSYYRTFLKEFDEVVPYLTDEIYTVGCGSVLITVQRSSKFLWRWKWSKKKCAAYDLDVIGNIVWYITSEEDTYKNRLICENSEGHIIWSRSQVSQQVAIKDGICYYIKVENLFNAIELCACNALTGEDEHIIYKERDEKRDLVLALEAGRTLYLKSVDAGSSKCWRVDGHRIYVIDRDTVLQIPLGQGTDGIDCRIVRRTHTSPLEYRGRTIKEWIMPPGFPEWISIQSGHVLTIHNGAHTIWYCKAHTRPRKLFEIPAGEVSPNPWSKWENQMTQSFYIQCPLEPPFSLHILHTQISMQRSYPVLETKGHSPIPDVQRPLHVRRLMAPSLDGTRVPYVVVQAHQSQPKALLVIGYGAYGSSTPVSWPNQSWYPILKRGWAVVYAFIRGGGDNDDAWAEAGRLTNRHKTIEDFEGVVLTAQRVLRVPPERTVIYGRSAGGLLVGATTARNPYGQLMRATFTEVPYVDLLRTQTNPDLPLTVGEYSEFGNPLQRIEDFAATLKISPIDALPEGGVPGVFVLARTGLKDRQVFAYEPFKWIQRLRGIPATATATATGTSKEYESPRDKYIAFEANEAHVYSTKRFFRSRALDLAVLQALLEGKIKSHA